MPCFENVEIGVVIHNFEKRFHAKKNEKELNLIIEDLIKKSYDNFWTKKYDSFQKMTNGIYP
jgi:phosphatidylinositol kinase/protein kinase (PI-3  family)